MILLGMLAAGLGVKGFLVPAGFIDGGVMGVSMLASVLSGVALPVFVLLINAPFVAVAYFQISPAFAVRSVLAIGGLAACLAFIPYPVVSEDKLLAALFGGFFVGSGIGLAMRGRAILDGTEVLALLLSKRVAVTVGDVIFGLNVVIFSVAAVFLGIEPALYSMLTYFSASRTIDFWLYGIEEYNAVIIVSSEHERIKKAILHELKRGVTAYKGNGGLSENKQEILLCVVTRLEVARVKNLVREIDESAFVIVHHVSDASGGLTKKRALH